MTGRALTVGAVVAGLLGIPAAANAAVAPPKFKYAFTFGSPGHGRGQFDTVLGISATPGGGSKKFVFVVDSHNERIQRFDLAGKDPFTWGHLDDTPSGPGGDANGYFFPQDVSFDGNNAVYVADTANNRIEKTDTDGDVVWKVGSSQGAANDQFNNPAGVAPSHRLARDDVVYVTDTRNSRVVVLDAATGAFRRTWGTPGSGNGQFRVPIDVATCQDAVYVTEEFGSRVQKFTTDGGFQLRWGALGGDGTPGDGQGQFRNPDGVATDSECNVYVAEPSTVGRIQIFDENGDFLAVVTGEGTPAGPFHPHDVTVGNVQRSDGANVRRLFISDFGNGRIVVFDEDVPPFPDVPIRHPQVTDKELVADLTCPMIYFVRCTLDASLQVKPTKRHAVISKATVLAHRKLTIKTGKTAKLRLPFTRSAKRLIAKRKRVAATLVIAIRDGKGHKRTTRKSVTLRR